MGATFFSNSANDNFSIRAKKGCWKNKIYCQNKISSKNSFIFMRIEDEVTKSSIWNDKTKPKLWLYNLHYFDFLNSKSSNPQNLLLYSILESWISANTNKKEIAWDPYPTSLRVINWVKWISSGNEVSARVTQSLYEQIINLDSRLEYHILGNHLFENAKALCFAGLFFAGKRSDKWLSWYAISIAAN